MRYASGHKEETRQHILEAAARELRRRGIAATSITELMSRVGMTHGGFYAHFQSKGALVTEALGLGLQQTAKMIETVAERVPSERRLEAIFDAHLSLMHRNHPEAGCVLAALGGEIARREAPQGQALRPYLEQLIGVLVSCVPAGSTGAPEDRALAMMASMVGGIVMARLAPDDASAERIFRAVKSLAFGQQPDRRAESEEPV
jgi:TetR/AcrR family transcriptional regulator, transcriptional repressor for nem operon